MNELGHKFEPITDILNELTTMCPRHGVSRFGVVLHLYLLAVSDRASRRGIAQGLVNACIENGAIRGYRVAVAEATSKVSRHIFCKLGFVTLAQVSFQFCLFKGHQVFTSIEGTAVQCSCRRHSRSKAEWSGGLNKDRASKGRSQNSATRYFNQFLLG